MIGKIQNLCFKSRHLICLAVSQRLLNSSKINNGESVMNCIKFHESYITLSNSLPEYEITRGCKQFNAIQTGIIAHQCILWNQINVLCNIFTWSMDEMLHRSVIDRALGNSTLIFTFCHSWRNFSVVDIKNQKFYIDAIDLQGR